MDIFTALIETGKWSEEQAQLGIDFNFKCTYCYKDMVSCIDNHSEWQADHIIPSSKGGDDSKNNLALCCRTCNFIKGTWNPSDVLKNSKKEKADLIVAAREYIFKKRKEMQANLDLYKKIISNYG